MFYTTTDLCIYSLYHVERMINFQVIGQLVLGCYFNYRIYLTLESVESLEFLDQASRQGKHLKVHLFACVAALLRT